MRYLTIYKDTHCLFCLDLTKPNRQLIRKAIAYLYLYEPMGYRSNHKNIFTARYERTGKGATEEQSRLIKRKHQVQRMKFSEAIELLEPLLARGRDKHQRKMSPNSLKNLKPAAPFNASTRPTRPRRITDDQLTQAAELRASGVSWKKVGDAIGHNFESVRTAMRRRNLGASKNSGAFTQRTGAENDSRYVCSH